MGPQKNSGKREAEKETSDGVVQETTNVSVKKNGQRGNGDQAR